MWSCEQFFSGVIDSSLYIATSINIDPTYEHDGKQ